jgi:two-component system chemotaxis sensor kinase CheA
VEDMDEIIQESLVASHEILDQLDRALVQLAQGPGAREWLTIELVSP